MHAAVVVYTAVFQITGKRLIPSHPLFLFSLLNYSCVNIYMQYAIRGLSTLRSNLATNIICSSNTQDVYMRSKYFISTVPPRCYALLLLCPPYFGTKLLYRVLLPPLHAPPWAARAVSGLHVLHVRVLQV